MAEIIVTSTYLDIASEYYDNFKYRRKGEMPRRTVFKMCSLDWITWIDTSSLQIFGN